MEIWCNEAQERYVLAIKADDLEIFHKLCERERCPYAVIGETTTERHLVLNDSYFETTGDGKSNGDTRSKPIDLELSVLFGKPPKLVRDVKRIRRKLPAHSVLVQ